MTQPNLIYLPIEPLAERYTDQWYNLMPPAFEKAGFKVRVISGVPLHENEIRVGTFLDINSTVHYKMSQLAQLAALFSQGLVEPNTAIFVGDAEFWGLESIKLMSQMNNVPVYLTAFLHAGSYTKEDAFEIAAPYQRFTEVGWLAACDKVFVGSEYHKQAFFSRRVQPLNLPSSDALNLQRRLLVTGNPLFEEAYDELPLYKTDKTVILTNRLDTEKRPLETLNLFRHVRAIDPSIKFVVTSGRPQLRSNSPVIEQEFKKAQEEGLIDLKIGLTKSQYHEELSKARVMVSHSIEENYGYCIVEALHYKVLPFLREGLSHNELVANNIEYLFDGNSLVEKQAAELINLVNDYDSLAKDLPKPSYNGLGYIIKNLLENIRVSPSSTRGG